MSENLVSLQHLKLDLITSRGLIHAVRDISLDIRAGETHGIVGESGCGKTMTAKSILRLHDEKKTFYSGKIIYNSGDKTEDIMKMNRKDLGAIRGKDIAMIFQDPMTTFDPLITVGEQIRETILIHENISKQEATERVYGLLDEVGIYPPEKRYKQYPFEFSGGMLQRASIAMAVACRPKLLIADEATTALDVTMQAQILDLLKKLKDEYHMSIVIITHNFGVIAELCDRVSVMYAGKIVETGDVSAIFHQPKHPYTKDLIDSIPRNEAAGEKLVTIPGFPPRLDRDIAGCPYAPRCRKTLPECRMRTPELTDFGKEHRCSCHLYDEGGVENI